MTQDYIIIQLLNRIEVSTGVTFDEICSTSRKANVVTARFAFCWYLRTKHTRLFTLQYIGKIINRDHSCVMSAVNVVRRALAKKNTRYQFILDIESKLSFSTETIKHQDYGKLRNKKIADEKRQEVINHYINEIQRVCGEKPSKIGQKHEDTFPRQLLYYFLYEYTNIQLCDICNIYNHTNATILSAVRKIRDIVINNKYNNKFIQEIQIYKNSGYFCAHCGCQRYDSLDF